MNRQPKKLLVGLFFCIIVSSASARDHVDPIAQLKADMPIKVAALIDRIVDCNHWSGEEPYDKERKAEIDSAIKSLKCETLERDEREITKRYSNDPRVKERIRRAKDEVL